jgi:hypothetical protein
MWQNRIDAADHPRQHWADALTKTMTLINPMLGTGLHQIVGVHFSLTASQGGVKGAGVTPWLIGI